MAYPSVHGSGQSYSRDAFGRRLAETGALRRRGVSRTLFASVLGVALLLSLWSGATTYYMLFRDDALRALATRQASTSRAYDAQIVALDTEIERLRSIKFIDQARIERALAELTRLQRTIEARHGALQALAQALPRSDQVTGSVPRSVPAATPAPTPNDSKPRPLSDVIRADPPASRSAALQSRIVMPNAASVSADAAPDDALEREVVAMLRALSHIGTEQSAALNKIETELDERAGRVRKVLADLGTARAPSRPATVHQDAPAGGPFIPWGGTPEDPFARQIFRIRNVAGAYGKLTSQLDGIPVLPPVVGSVEVTSGFGTRVDPFMRQLAVHSGVDLRGDTGEPVRAAASGVVTFAAQHGGYGNMVEIDHGNGLATRYAHLSAIAVKEGMTVPAGAIVGRIGSTGRSTGPHLHYEVRLNGDAVDPQRYLRAGLRLAANR